MLFRSLQDERLRFSLSYREVNPHLFRMLHIRISDICSKAYKPSINSPIPSQFLPAFIRLIRESPTDAAFSVLTMYSIRHRTLTSHPASFDHLFGQLPDSEKLSYGTGKLTIPSQYPCQIIRTHSQGTNLYRTYSSP